MKTVPETQCAETNLCPEGTSALASGFSIEVMPRTAEKIQDFRQIIPRGTRVYIAHIEGTPVDSMAATAKRIASEGFPVMPHITARAIRDEAELERLIYRYREEAGVRQALVLAGGMKKPAGEFHSSVQLLKTQLFDKAGYTDIHMAGHPEGNRDIDPGGGTENTDAALREKWEIARSSCARMALVTQFAFSEEPVIAWARRLEKSGILFPIHVGVAGPAKLRTLIKFAVACGVGPSLRILRRRAEDFSRLLTPVDAADIVRGLARYKMKHPDSRISQLHIFPLGGIRASAEWGRKLAAQSGGRPGGRTGHGPDNH